MKKLLFVIFIVPLLFGCFDDKRFKCGTSDGMVTEEYIYCASFISPSIGFLGGRANKQPFLSGKPREKGKDYSDAKIWRTMDGGISWEGKVIDDGIVHTLVYNGGIIYALLYQYTIDGIKSTIWSSSDRGDTWQKRYAIEDRGIPILYIADSLNWFRIGSDKIFETKDAGQSWEVSKFKYNYMTYIFPHDMKVYYLTKPYPNAPKDNLFCRDLSTGEDYEIPLPEGRSGNRGFGDIVVLTHERNAELYEIREKSLKLLSVIPYSKGMPYVNFISRKGDRIFCSIYSFEGSLFTRYDGLLYSSDNGKTWKRIASYVSTDAICTYEDDSVFRLFRYDYVKGICYIDAF